jgi:uroporphyrinogen-III synthase
MSDLLNNKRILITRPQHQAVTLAQLVEKAGGQAICFPTLEIVPLTDNQATLARLKNLKAYQWVIFISSNAVNFALQANDGKIDNFKSVKIAAVGKATARTLQAAGLTPDLVPESSFNSEALLAMLKTQDLNQHAFLIMRGEGGREMLAESLRESGATVDYCEVYKRIMPVCDNSVVCSLVQQHKIDMITITSSEALQNLLIMLAQVKQLLFAIPLCVISDRIKQIAVAYGFKQVLVTESPADAAIFKIITSV